MSPEDQDRLRMLLTDTVLLLCKNGLSYTKGFSIEGLIGITVDQNDVFLVSLREEVKSTIQEVTTHVVAQIPSPSTLLPSKRKATPCSPSKIPKPDDPNVLVKQEREDTNGQVHSMDWSIALKHLQSGQADSGQRMEEEEEEEEENFEDSQHMTHVDNLTKNPLATALDLLDDQSNESTFDASITDSARMFCCEVCNKSFRSESSFKVHQVIHTGAHKCQYCGKCFACNSKLRTHLSTHDSTLKLPCMMCNKSFAGPSELKRHTDIAHKPL